MAAWLLIQIASYILLFLKLQQWKVDASASQLWRSALSHLSHDDLPRRTGLTAAAILFCCFSRKDKKSIALLR